MAGTHKMAGWYVARLLSLAADKQWRRCKRLLDGEELDSLPKSIRDLIREVGDLKKSKE